jgi:plastocyanin
MKLLAMCLGVACVLTALTFAQSTKTITMRDACDPDSFNAAVGPGTCVAGAHGTTLFPDFIAELQEDKIVGAWRFNPLLNATEGHFNLVRLNLKPGDHITITNAGGETHTFTRVEKFGGGFIDVLNGLSGNPDPSPECAQVLPDGSLAPQPESDTNQVVEAGKTEAGPTAGSAALPRGMSRWECCIHPWMRMLVTVKGNDD